MLGAVTVYFGGCSLEVEKPAPRKTEPIKGEYVDNGFGGKLALVISARENPKV